MDCIVSHRPTEAGNTLCIHMLKAVEEDAQTIRILSNNTDVFVLLVYWASKKQITAKIQMENEMGMSWISMTLFSS